MGDDITTKINALTKSQRTKVQELINTFKKSEAEALLAIEKRAAWEVGHAQQNKQIVILSFLIIAMIIGFFATNTENFSIMSYMAIAILLATTLFTVINRSFSHNDGNMKKKLIFIILFFILIHLSPMIRHERYNNNNPQWNTLNNILFEDHTNHITNKFLLITLLVIPAILIYIEFLKNGDGKKNKFTRGIILAWLAIFVMYIFNVPEGKKLASEHRETMYKQFIVKYTTFTVLFLLLWNSSNRNSSKQTKSNLAIALILVIIANVASRILNRSTDGQDESSVLTPSRIPESIQIFITIALLILMTLLIMVTPEKKEGGNFISLLRSLVVSLAPVFILLVNIIIICFAYIPAGGVLTNDGVLEKNIVLITLIGIVIFKLTFHIFKFLLRNRIDNPKIFYGLSFIISGLSCVFIYINLIEKLDLNNVNKETESLNIYGTDAGPGLQVDALWKIRISDIIDLLVQISAQIIVLYLIARCLDVRSNSDVRSDVRNKFKSIIILIVIAFFVGVSLFPVLSPIVLIFTVLWTLISLSDPHSRANLLQSLRNIGGKKTIESESSTADPSTVHGDGLAKLGDKSVGAPNSSDVDNFLLSEIKEKLKI